MDSRKQLEESEDMGTLETLRLLGRAFRYVAPFRWRFAAKTGLLLLSLLPLLVLPWPVKIILDHVIGAVPIGEQPIPYPAVMQPFTQFLSGREPSEILFWACGLQLLLVFLVGAVGTGGAERDQADAYLASGHDQATTTENAANAGFSMASGLLGLFDFRFTIRLTQALNHHYRARLFERIQALPMTAFDDERIGDAVFRVMYDTPSITNSVYRIVLTPLASVLFAALVVFVLQHLFGEHPLIVYSALGVLVIAFVATLPFSAALRRRSSRSRKAGATSTSTLEEGLSNILAVQSLGGEERERGRFDTDSWAAFSRHRAQMALGMVVFMCALVPGLIVGARVFEYIANLVIEGVISIGDFGLLFTYFIMLTFACVEIGALWIRLQEAAVGLHRVFFLMDLPGEEDPPGAAPIARLREAVEIDNAEYSYPDGTQALRGISLRARVGEVTALVGPAGAGKTTLAWLIPRFAEPSRGAVRFDGVDLNGAALAAIRSQVAFVFQETVLFDASVEENIRLGNREASETEVRRAAQIAGADAFIRQLPQGYRTPLGRAGGKLSVGQRQRIAIARALVRDAPILILDEPTSALDPETEQALVRALREASRTRVVIVIAHRLSTVRDADQVLFIQEGRVVERGTHAELMALADGHFRRFVDLQNRGAA
jgi:ABC-type multidrug transport system fused ATPase/permease subunit